MRDSLYAETLQRVNFLMIIVLQSQHVVINKILYTLFIAQDLIARKSYLVITSVPLKWSLDTLSFG